jgi:UPF0755 protein
MLAQALRDRTNRLILIGLALSLTIVTLGLREIANRPVTYSDFVAGESRGSATIVIGEGATGEEIARELDGKGVIASWQVFFRLAIVDQRAKRIAPGTYNIDKRIPAEEALEQLLDLDRIQGLIPLRDGVRVDEVVELLESLGYEGVADAVREIERPNDFTNGSLEGYLYPARYSFPPNTSSKAVIAAMVRRFEEAVNGLNLASLEPDFSREQVITIASLVEAEGTPDVFRRVARVIFNRLEIGMPLQLDSTVHYIQGSRGRIALSLKETQEKSPFNTYLNRGLPPSPIGSPTKAAITATLNPEPGDWIYFITVAPKDTRFTSSYEQFLEWKSLYRSNLGKGLFDDD